MAFWYSPTTSPKRQYRWLMNIGGIPQWIIKKVNKPSFTINEAKHNYLNHTFYYPGRVEYEKSSITLVDPVSPDASAIMMAILEGSGYSIPNTANVTQTISKKNATSALGNVTITQLGAEGQPIDQFTFINAWLTSAKFGDLDYEGDNLIDLTMEIRYDFVSMPLYGAENGTSNPDLSPYVGSPTTGPATGARGRTIFDPV